MREGQKSLLAEEQLKKEQLASAASVAQQQQQIRPPAAEDNKRSSSSDSFSKDDRDSPILNLSSKHDNNSDLSGDDDVYVSDNDDDLASNEDKSGSNKIDITDKSEDKVNNNGTSAVPTQGPGGLPNPGLLAGLPGLLASSESGSGEGQLASVYGLMSNIQALIKVAVENAKKEERNNAGNLELKTDSKGLEREMEEVKKNRDIYLRRFKKEKRYRRKVQEQLEVETQRRLQMEEALRNMTSGMASSEALKRITESLTQNQNTISDPNSKLNNSSNSDDKRSSSPLEDTKDRRESGDDPRSSPASSSASNVALAAAAAAAAPAQFNATVSTSEASSDRGTPPRGKHSKLSGNLVH